MAMAQFDAMQVLTVLPKKEIKFGIFKTIALSLEQYLVAIP